MTQQQNSNSSTMNPQEAQRIGRTVGERVQQELEQRFGSRQATAREVIDATSSLDWGKYISDATTGQQQQQATQERSSAKT